MQEKELLRKLGEETLYSAKGHFKSCDLRRQLVTYTIWLCAILNVISVIGINSTADKILAAAGLFGTIALLIWNEGESKNYRAKHKQIENIFEQIDEKLDSKKVDLIIGGPPCQAYSLVGRSRDPNRMEGDKRNFLFRYYAKFLIRYQPKYFVFEKEKQHILTVS